MHAVIRTYSGKGAKELMDVLEKSKAEVDKLIRSVKGFVSYSLVRTARGGFSVSVYQDKAGADESIRVARDWVGKNAGKTGAAAPTVSEGTVILHAECVWGVARLAQDAERKPLLSPPRDEHLIGLRRDRREAVILFAQCLRCSLLTPTT